MRGTPRPLPWTGPFGVWGARPDEVDRPLRCDDVLSDPDQRLVRAVDVAAPAPVVFRWLCQLRVAPYSYDWIDNGGRRSPRTLTPGLELLELGQPVMRSFVLAAVEPGRSITLVHDGRNFGRVAVTYVVTPRDAVASRLLVRILVRYRRGARGAALSAVLPAGDFVMMRRQLLNLRDRAEESARGA